MQRNKPFLLTLLVIGYFVIIAVYIFIVVKRNQVRERE
jgi:hypothetical protein